MSTEVVRLLTDVHEIAAHACGSAPQGMAERWAEEYVAGNWEKRQDELIGGAKGYNNEGGASLIRIVDSYRRLLEYWKGIASSLPADSDQSAAQNIYNAFDKVSDTTSPLLMDSTADSEKQAVDEYWAIIRRTGEGLRLPGTQRYIGGQFRRILENHRDAFNAAATKLVAEIEPLGQEKQAKVQEWVDRSGPKFEDAINAAKGK